MEINNFLVEVQVGVCTDKSIIIEVQQAAVVQTLQRFAGGRLKDYYSLLATK